MSAVKGSIAPQTRRCHDPRRLQQRGSAANHDVIHVLGTTGSIAHLSEAQRDRWAAQIDSYQNADGFYNHSSSNSKYHAAGEATAWRAQSP